MSSTVSCDAVEVGHLVEEAVHAAFGARAVVADDVEDRACCPAGPCPRWPGPAGRPRGRRTRRSRRRLPSGGRRASSRRRVSLSQSLIAAGLGASLVSGGDDAELLLPGQRLLAELVPALVELALVLGDPLLRHVVRSVRGARGEVDEERLVRRERFHGLGPVDRLVGHVGHEVVVRILRRLDLVHARRRSSAPTGWPRRR